MVAGHENHEVWVKEKKTKMWADEQKTTKPFNTVEITKQFGFGRVSGRSYYERRNICELEPLFKKR